jgi:hypothetical protein
MNTEGIIRFGKGLFTNRQKKSIKNMLRDLRTVFSGNDLNKLASIYKTDKYGSHYYTQHYQKHFEKYKYKRVNLLEIGVGGYKKPQGGGQSLRMWKRYFPFGKITSIDIYDKSFLEERRVRIFRGSQVDEAFMTDVIRKIGRPDLIIDDGSHHNAHVSETFKILFPLLKEGGIYAVEDTQTSYWPDFGGDADNLENPNTTMNFFKRLTDGLNYKEFASRNGYKPTYYDQNIISIHFYHNLIFIYKGKNDERGIWENVR